MCGPGMRLASWNMNRLGISDERLHRSAKRPRPGSSLAAESTIRPRPIANRPQDAILPHMWNQRFTSCFLESVGAARRSAQCHILFDCRSARTWVALASPGAQAAKAAGQATKNDPASLRTNWPAPRCVQGRSMHRLKPMLPRMDKRKSMWHWAGVRTPHR
jgi:hypothetical protein